MKNLFVIYLGGSYEGALIELHDIRLVISDVIENTYDTLKKSWWGTKDSLHLDAWGILRWADGHRIEIVESSDYSENPKKLYFLNLGGYDSKQFTELHKNIFVVAANEQEAKSRAIKNISHWDMPHKDYLFDVEKIIDVGNLLPNTIKLVPCDDKKDFEFICKYVPLGK